MQGQTQLRGEQGGEERGGEGRAGRAGRVGRKVESEEAGLKNLRMEVKTLGERIHVGVESIFSR